MEIGTYNKKKSFNLVFVVGVVSALSIKTLFPYISR
jgi:hypothetical protein